MTEPRRRARQLYRTQETLWAVYADHGDRVCRFVAMCIDRTDADRLAAEMSHIGDVYILPHSAERHWRSPLETEVTTPAQGMAVVPQ